MIPTCYYRNKSEVEEILAQYCGNYAAKFRVIEHDFMLFLAFVVDYSKTSNNRPSKKLCTYLLEGRTG